MAVLAGDQDFIAEIIVTAGIILTILCPLLISLVR